MAIWSMGSQTQILIGYLPVPAPLLCKYWTSTFFTVTCIWKKKEKKKKSRRESESSWGDVENRHGWVDRQRANSPPPYPPFIISQLPPLFLSPKPPTNKCNSHPVPLSFRTKRKSLQIMLHSCHRTLQELLVSRVWFKRRKKKVNILSWANWTLIKCKTFFRSNEPQATHSLRFHFFLNWN